jgi:hypothetical protein
VCRYQPATRQIQQSQELMSLPAVYWAQWMVSPWLQIPVLTLEQGWRQGQR